MGEKFGKAFCTLKSYLTLGTELIFMQDIEQQSLAKECERLGNIVKQALGIIHDVNTPLGISLTAITHFQDMLNKLAESVNSGKLKKSDMDKFLAASDEITSIIAHNLERASDLAKNFQQIASDEAQQQQVLFNAHDYIKKVLQCFQPELNKHGHAVQLIAPPDLVINSLPGVWSQIILNLLANSVKHAYSPGEKGTIKIEIKADKTSVNLRYSDDGKGIQAQDMNKIFDIFYTSKKDGSSSGLGLYIVHDAVTRLLQGSIRCASEEGQGVAFDINIPLH
jgi:signal transduction histidine kinase